MKKLLCLPIELYQREIQPKLYLALEAADRGYQVLVGYHNDPVFDKVQDGFYLYKDHASCSEGRLKKKKDKGMVTGVLDEEGLIYDEELYLKLRVSNEIIDTVDALFLWGNRQLKTIKKVSSGSNNRFMVGSPKFDYFFLRKKTCNSFGEKRRVLINTRFTYVNGFRRGREIDVLENLGYFSSDVEKEKFKLFIKDDEKIYQEFRKLIEALSEDARFEVTIRPHPAEDYRFYKRFEDLANGVKVDNESQLVDQILGNDVLVHDGCSTAIEARALGAPVLGLRPNNLKHPYNDYANKFSLNFENYEGLVSYLAEVPNYCDLMKDQPDVYEEARYRIVNWDGAVLSANNIVNVVDSFGLRGQPLVEEPLMSLAESIKCKRALSFFVNKNYAAKKVLNFCLPKRKLDILSSYQEVLDNKFPRVDLETINKELKSIAENRGDDDRKYVVRRVTDYAFVVFSE